MVLNSGWLLGTFETDVCACIFGRCAESGDDEEVLVGITVDGSSVRLCILGGESEGARVAGVARVVGVVGVVGVVVPLLWTRQCVLKQVGPGTAQKHEPHPVQCRDLTEALHTTTLMLIPVGRSLFIPLFPRELVHRLHPGCLFINTENNTGQLFTYLEEGAINETAAFSVLCSGYVR